jgi:hypothetical protein
MTSEQKQHLTRFLIPDIEQELEINQVSKSRIKEITNFYKKVLGSKQTYCVSAHNSIGKSVMKDLTLEEWKRSEIIAPWSLKNFRCYNNPTRIYIQAYYTKIENTIVPVIMQRWVPKYNDFTPHEERTTYYLPVDAVDNIINNL